MESYQVTKVGTGLSITTGDGRKYVFPEPEMDTSPDSSYPLPDQTIEIRSRTYLLQITADDTVTVAGIPLTGTLLDKFNQLSSLT